MHPLLTPLHSRLNHLLNLSGQFLVFCAVCVSTAPPALAAPLEIDQDNIGPRWLGVNYQDNLGWHVSSAGDLNGDGLGDFAATAPQDAGPVTFDSVVRIFFGRAEGAPTSGDASWADVSIRDGKVGTDAIFQMAFTPDFDGDGKADIAVALPNASQTGKAMVLPGGGNSWPSELSAGDAVATWTGYMQAENSDLSTETRPSDVAGGDFDGDGLGDIVIASAVFQRVWVHYGHSGTGTYSLEDVENHFEDCLDEAPASDFGSSIVTGDFNGDGTDDLAIGGPGCESGLGQVFIRYGSDSGLPITADLVIGDGERLGSALMAGDINADGIVDLFAQELLSSNGTDPSRQDRGNLRIYLGDSQGLPSTASQVITGGFSDKRFGATAAVLPDISNPADGIPELVIGAPESAFDGQGQGAVYVFMSPSAAGTEIPANDAKYQITGSRRDAWFGASVATVDDFDGNGYPEVVIGEPNYTEGESENDYERGRIYLLSALPDRDEDEDGASTLNGDCDDQNPDVSPTDIEVCDGIDNDCDHTIDEGCDEGDDDDSAAEDEKPGGGDSSEPPSEEGCACSTVSDTERVRTTGLLAGLFLAGGILRRRRAS